MKKLVSIALVLVLVLGLCATAFADYYPTGKFTAKNQTFKYGKNYTVRYRVDHGTGPFYKIGSYYRANFDLYLKSGSKKVKLADYNYTGTHNLTTTVYGGTSSYKSIIKKPKNSKKVAYQLRLTTWYKTSYTIGSTTYIYKYWSKNKTVTTNLYIKR